MNLRGLHQSVTASFDRVRPAIDHIFTKTIAQTIQSGHAVNVAPFLVRMNKALDGSGVRVRLERNAKYGKPSDTEGTFYPSLGGYCYEPADPAEKLARVQLIVCIHPDINRFPLSAAGWQYFRFRFLKTAAHELVHRGQYAANRDLDNPLVFRPSVASHENRAEFDQQVYLGDIDEIEAYARDAVEEWYYFYPTAPLTIAGLKKDFRGPCQLPALQYYRDTFKKDEQHLAVQRLFLKVREWNRLIVPIALNLPPVNAQIKKERAKYPIAAA